MERFVIRGGVPLHGTVVPSGNKNAALPMLAATLLTDQPVTLRNLPNIGDVRTMLALLADLGAGVTHHDNHTVTVHAAGGLGSTPDSKLFSEIRGSLTLLGPILARTRRMALALPGGDRIGRRRIDTHLTALRALGANVKHNDRLELAADRLHGAQIWLDEASVTGTENAVMAACLARGETVIRNAASEPHVQELCHMLNTMGAQIEGIGSNVLRIEGHECLGGGECTIGPDFMEVGSFVGLAAVTGGAIRIAGAAPEHLGMIRSVFERLSVHTEVEGDDVLVPGEQVLEVVDDLGGAVPKIDDAPWPGFPSDLMSITLVMATQARGTVLMHEKMFDSRLYFVDRLIGMGARIILCDPHRAVVVGPSRLHGEELSSPDIRAGMALLLAALCAEGTSVIYNIHQIDRGYERIEEKLQALGAQIERVSP
ncbi:MAG TPA: UDP-N-acetylglucosamine 1-carboxyvinyltransferase [Anaerolineae bacterium]|nr:UDP-N-acetylglucosamine 1-carboxyvinyltransferase [Anaerolineae bacterium]